MADESFFLCGGYGAICKRGCKAIKCVTKKTGLKEEALCAVVTDVEPNPITYNILLPDWKAQLSVTERTNLRIQLIDQETLCGEFPFDPRKKCMFGVMPYKNYSMLDLIGDHGKLIGPSSTQAVASDIAKGIGFLHDRCDILHGDLGPANVMLDVHETDSVVTIDRCYIIDLGCAKRLAPGPFFWDSSDCLNPCITPPELLLKTPEPQGVRQSYTYKSAEQLRTVDYWALGVLCDLICQVVYQTRRPKLQSWYDECHLTPNRQPLRWICGIHTRDDIRTNKKAALDFANTTLPLGFPRRVIERCLRFEIQKRVLPKDTPVR